MLSSLCVDVSQGAQGHFATFARLLDRHHGKDFAEGVGGIRRPAENPLKAASLMVLAYSHGMPAQAPGREGITLHISGELVVL
ncbi:hypothetical protein [Pseudomonas sp. Pseusp97]|uniref:hypothetical protein n=1 Tax=Pseudomonas sp. Pseusp97 TaxID=3243065 RepID=UPI0039A6D89F